MPPAVMPRLAQQAWSFNARMGITGEIRFEDGRFFQTIEGPCDVLLALASRILTDRRHERIAVSRWQPIAARRYRDWTATGFAVEGAVMRPDFSGASNLRILPAVAALRPEMVPTAALGAT